MHQDSGTPQGTEPGFECLSIFYGGMGQQWLAVGIGALVAAELGSMACESHHRATEQTTHKLENSYTEEVPALLVKVVKILGPTTDFPTWGSSKGTEKTQGI